MHFTLVSTIFNEAKRLPQTIADLEAQTMQPAEIIITDAGSTDGTWDMLMDWKARSAVPIVLLQEQRCNVARGRNLAIAAAKTDLIVSTDFGCRFHPKWLESLASPFANNIAVVTGGAYTVIEPDIHTLAAKGNYILTNGYHVEMNDGFIPSSRSIAYKKEVWEKVEGYCEWLTLAADDLVFGMQIKSLGYSIHLVHEPYVFWGRHTHRRQYAKEAFRYGLGDGEARVNVRNTQVIAAETVLRYLSVFSLLFLATIYMIKGSSFLALLPLLLFLIGSLGFRPYLRTLKNWLRLKSKKYNLKVFLYALFMMEEQRITYLKGYVKGYFFSTNNQKAEAIVLQNKLRHKI